MTLDKESAIATVNIEFKARTTDLAAQEEKLQALHPYFAGEDHQVDTYFRVPSGRLKLREGNIENALIYYERDNTPGAKQSDILIYAHQPGSALKGILEKACGIRAVVDKRRRIYFIGHVKFHFDRVIGLGDFMEVEVIDTSRKADIGQLREQCDQYARYFGISPQDMVAFSYSDLLIQARQTIEGSPSDG